MKTNNECKSRAHSLLEKNTNSSFFTQNLMSTFSTHNHRPPTTVHRPQRHSFLEKNTNSSFFTQNLMSTFSTHNHRPLSHPSSQATSSSPLPSDVFVAAPKRRLRRRSPATSSSPLPSSLASFVPRKKLIRITNQPSIFNLSAAAQPSTLNNPPH